MEELKNLCMDIKATLQSLEADLDVVAEGRKLGWKAAALRGRNKTVALQKLGKAFRKLSIAESKRP